MAEFNSCQALTIPNLHSPGPILFANLLFSSNGSSEEACHECKQNNSNNERGKSSASMIVTTTRTPDTTTMEQIDQLNKEAITFVQIIFIQTT
jgi:hypothetical protein